VSYESTNQEESVFSSLSRDFENTLGATNGDESSLSENLINDINLTSSENLISENRINGMNSNSSENLINNGTN